MAPVTTTGEPAAGTEPAPVRLDRPVLIGNLVSGALWLSPLAYLSPTLLVIGAAYVVAGALFLAAVYARRVLTRKQEALAWVTPWFVAVALWAAVLVGISFQNAVSHYLAVLCFGVLIATPCYLAWQIVALAVRQFIAWRSGTPTLPA